MESITDQIIRENLAQCDIEISEGEFPKIKDRLFYDPSAFDGYFQTFVSEGNHEFKAFYLVHALYYFVVGRVPYRDYDAYRKSVGYREFKKLKKLKIENS